MDNTTEAELVGSTYTSSGALTVEATDNSSITSVGGGIGVSVSGTKTNLGFGLAIASNQIDGDVRAAITDSDVFAPTGVTVSASGKGDLTVTATSAPTINALTIAGAIAPSISDGKGLRLAGAGAGAGNTIHTDVTAAIEGASTVTRPESAVTVKALDNATIIA